MSEIAGRVVEWLGSDMVSHGLLLQAVQREGDPRLDWRAVVRELLSEGVEIGEARPASPDYVEFIAWRGTIDDRVARAAERVSGLAARDREFAYWLALQKNVDRFEADST